VGESHTCGLTAAGAAYCWGQNAAGQLGVGDAVLRSSIPLPVTGGLTFATLSAGDAHTCGLTTNGVAYCWGWNFDGQLGTGSAGAPSGTPVIVAPRLSFLAIASGHSHTCAVEGSGVAYCWGQNLSGRLGTGTTTAAIVPTPGRVVGELVFTRVTAGEARTCAVATGSAWYCWGENQSGGLGVGTTTDSGTPVKVLGQP
jgi:alpha-tubulin suppressor-like RCC1 family protein